jgi:hypothetical protein
MMEGATVFAIVFVASVFVTALMGARQAPQGRYPKTLTPGGVAPPGG